MKIKLRYIALILITAILTPHVKNVIEYAGQVKATYEMGVAVEEAAEVMLAYNLPMGGK